MDTVSQIKERGQDWDRVSTPVVSVLMVVCNADRFLRESIESILCQTFKDFEFIIVDFGSTDNSKEIISRYAAKDCRIRFKSISHCGLAEARNASCSFARSPYIAIMDADDISVPSRLMWEVEFMERHPEIAVLGGAVEWIDAVGRPLITWGNPLDDSEIQSALLERCPLWQPTVIMRREAFDRVGGYRPPFAPAEDYDLWLRIAEHYEFANLAQVVLKYRIHPFQVSVRKRRNQTLGILAARVSAASRRGGGADPFRTITELNSELLASYGVSEEAQNTAYAIDYLKWIRNLAQAHEYSSALKEVTQLLQSGEWKYLDRRQIADLHLTVAVLCWKEKKPLKSLLAAGQALTRRPLIVGRPLKQLLHRLGFA